MSDIQDAKEARRLYQLLQPYFVTRTGALDLGRGTTFPTIGPDGGAVAAGSRFFRTDLGWLCYYDGTRWLTAHEYHAVLTEYQRVTFPYTGGSPATLLIAPMRTDYSLYITRAKAYADIATTNNGSNYWGFALRNGGTSIWQFDTSADAAGAALNKESGALSSVQAPAFMAFDVVAKVGAPGSAVVNAGFWYRLVVT